VHERGGEIEPALHPARVALDAAVGRLLELDEREQILGARRRGTRGEAEQPSLQDEQLAPGLARVEPGLLQRHADAPPHRVGLLRDVHASHAGGSRRDRQQRRQHAHRRRLPRAVRPQEAEDLACLDPQVDPSNRLDDSRPAVVLLDQRLGLHGSSRADAPGLGRPLLDHTCHVVHVLAPRSSSVRSSGRPRRMPGLIADRPPLERGS
jgi:hypothetical protein